MYEYKIQVTRVLDGDTVDGIIDLGYKTYVRKRIRFLGFNAPETRTRNKEEKVRGLIAKDWLINLCEEEKFTFILKSHGVGKYGRVLGELFTLEEKKSVIQMMLNENLGKEYYGGKR